MLNDHSIAILRRKQFLAAALLQPKMNGIHSTRLPRSTITLHDSEGNAIQQRDTIM
ncbi:hypothetical protein [Streptomyces albireticuli]|uniref:hypothetical protein n=1 Tax=Streptomyces albireticuli TaxID=1940 RepID=UPI001E471A56|nr:hypothetical protein [Streptomyces albireticuli]MCD9166310.1 hypothetical protein [Streptomyces albireticuli]MCD9196643.1 hypothetical protein [Streptomyces albireticuli]